ncbi:hypothetical protein Y032_0451g1683, partial [Ancylostoma ceylanicum]
KTPSNVITLGIGWDVLAEQKLKKLLPNETAEVVYNILSEPFAVDFL